MRYSEIITEEPDLSYQEGHTAPKHGDVASPLHDLGDGIFPIDFYEPNGFRYYCGTEAWERESYNIVVQCKAKPFSKIKIYRSVPAELDNVGINAGDWVSITRGYAKDHGASTLGNKYKIRSMTVPAYTLYCEGYISEWGYDPNAPAPTPDEVDEIRAKYGMPTLASAKEGAKTERARKLAELEKAARSGDQVSLDRFRNLYLANPAIYELTLGHLPDLTEDDVAYLKNRMSISTLTRDNIKEYPEYYQRIMGEKEKVQEAVGDDFLYHGTSIDKAYAILGVDKIEGRTEHRTMPNIKSGTGFKAVQNMPFSAKQKKEYYVSGVSTSRRLAFSRKWTGDEGVVFVLDRQAVRANNKVVAFSYYGRPHSAEPRKPDEAEEFVVGDIANLSKKLVAIYMTQTAYDNELEDSERQGYEPDLLKHPKLKIIK